MSHITVHPLIVSLPITVPDGGTGLTSVTAHSLVVGNGTSALTVLSAATDGEIPIGSTGADPVMANITSSGTTIDITNGAGSINMEVSGGVAMAMAADTGTATPAAHIITMAGGDNIETSASGNTVTMAVTPAMAGTTSHDFSNGGRIGTDVNASDTLYIQAYNVGMASYATFATLTAGNTPTMDLDDSVTKGGNYIYRAGGTDVSVADGGTGVSSLTDHGVLVGSGTGAVTPLAVGTNGQVLLGSDSADPVFATLASSGSTIAFTPGAGSLNLEIGPTVVTTLTADSGAAVGGGGVNSILVLGGYNISTTGYASTFTIDLDTAITGTASHDFAAGGRIGTATSAGNTLLLQAYDVDGAAYTTFATLTANNTPTMDLDDAVTKGGQYIYRAAGTDVSVADGGTGVSSLTDHGVLVGSGTGAVTPLAVGTNGQVLLGSDSADPVFATLASSGSTIAFTPGAGTLNLETGSAVCTSVTTDSGSAVPSSGVLSIVGGGDVTTSGSGSTVTVTYSGGSGGGLTWSEVTGTTQALVAGNGYIANNASLVTFTLPATATVGQVVAVKGLGAGGWKIAQNASQYIEWNSSTVTTTGVTGYLQCDDTKDYVELVCTVTNNGWGELASHGNITVA